MCFLCSFSPRHTSHNVKSVAIAFQDTFATLARYRIKLTDQILAHRFSIEVIQGMIEEKRRSFEEQKSIIDLSSLSDEDKSDALIKLRSEVDSMIHESDINIGRSITSEESLNRALDHVVRVIDDPTDQMTSEDLYLCLLKAEDSGEHALRTNDNIDVLNVIFDTMRTVLPNAHAQDDTNERPATFPIPASGQEERHHDDSDQMGLSPCAQERTERSDLSVSVLQCTDQWLEGLMIAIIICFTAYFLLPLALHY
jgi:hypothetical protein